MRTLLLSLLVAAPLARAQDAAPEHAADLAATAPVATSPASAPTAAELPVSPAPAFAIPPAAPAPRTGSRFGVLLETGIPEGVALGVTFRPVPSVRLWAAPTWNYISFGGQVGLAVVPFRWVISPVLSVEGGRFIRADLSRFVNGGSGAPSEIEPLLKNVAYDFAAAHLGLEIGSQRGFAFSLRGGLAYVRVTTHGRAASTSTATGDAQVYFVDPRLAATIPSVKLGFQYSF